MNTSVEALAPSRVQDDHEIDTVLRLFDWY